MTPAQPKTSAPDRLTRAEKLELVGWVKSRARPVRGGSDPFFLKLAKNPKLIAYLVDTCLLHFKDKPEVKRPGWVATCQKWILKAAGFAEEQRTQHGEKPQMQAPRGKVGSPVGDVIREIETRELFEGE